tara:strand:- start:770 stop:1225 length:456 start_codon:yes stop_codon:yes gene_type:complete
MDLMKKIFTALCFVFFTGYSSAQSFQGKVYVLGNMNEENKQIFQDTITQELHDYAQTISFQSESFIYVFPYQDDYLWRVVSFHVKGDQHHSQLSTMKLEGLPLRSLDKIREIIGLDGSLKYIGWSSYTELPSEQIFLASKSIVQDYLLLHF